MVLNTTGGNKSKKQKRGVRKHIMADTLDAGQMFGQIMENKGNHFKILCSDGITRCGRMVNSMKKGQRLQLNAYVVVSLREYETNQTNCDILAAGNPPRDIINLFISINPSKDHNYDNDMDFYDPDEIINEDSKIDTDNTDWSNI